MQSLEQEVDQAFSMYDDNGDGVLDVEEARKYLNEWMKRNMKEGEAIEIQFEDIDVDGNGVIDR